MTYVLLIIGFVCLVKGADFFVSGSSDIARRFSIPEFIIGLTIVAFGTSLPEAAVSVTAAMKEANGIALGNVLGSNLFNLLVVLGVSALFQPCPVDKRTLRFEYPLSIAAAALIPVLCIGGDGMDLALSRTDGIVLLVVFVFFLAMTVRGVVSAQGRAKKNALGSMRNGSKTGGMQSRAHGSSGAMGAFGTAGKAGVVSMDAASGTDSLRAMGAIGAAGETGKAVSLPKGIVLSVIGVAGIVFGGDVVVDCAVAIADSLGIDETLIGLTIAAVGTSLPELVTSVVAASKGKTDIAVGNVIGSNLFNLLFVLGLSVTIHPIQAALFSVYDSLILIGASLLVYIPFAKHGALNRKWGILMVLLYGIYMAYIIMRTM